MGSVLQEHLHCQRYHRDHPSDTEAEAARAYRGIALAFRAWDYMNLVQNFQFKYKGHEDAPSIPLVTDETTATRQGQSPCTGTRCV